MYIYNSHLALYSLADLASCVYFNFSTFYHLAVPNEHLVHEHKSARQLTSLFWVSRVGCSCVNNNIAILLCCGAYLHSSVLVTHSSGSTITVITRNMSSISGSGGNRDGNCGGSDGGKHGGREKRIVGVYYLWTCSSRF